MADIDPIEVAHGLMLGKARSVSRLEVRNELGDLPGIDDLTDDEFESLIAQVLDEWCNAEREALAPFNRPGDGGVL